ncbi:MAG: hypothetical protein ACKOA9_09170 [Actinomycetota bacterium]
MKRTQRDVPNRRRRVIGAALATAALAVAVVGPAGPASARATGNKAESRADNDSGRNCSAWEFYNSTNCSQHGNW